VTRTRPEEYNSDGERDKSRSLGDVSFDRQCERKNKICNYRAGDVKGTRCHLRATL
jgi:hypothetical protein